MSSPVITVKLTTPPTRNSLGGIYGAGHDNSHAREKFVDGVGNLNLAVQQLQEVVGIADSTTADVTGLLALVNGNLTPGNIATGHPSGNFKSIILQGTSPILTNTNFTLTHNLGVVPNGFIVLRKNKHADFFGDPSTGTWNTTSIDIQCDTTLTAYTIWVI